MYNNLANRKQCERRQKFIGACLIGRIATYCLIALAFLPEVGHAFNFFTAFSPSISQIGDHSYRFRVQVDYNFDMEYADNGMPAMGAFTGFSLGRLIGYNQRSFTPLGDDPGQEVRYTAGWWRTGHLGFYPLSLPGHEFGYDFDFAGSLPRTLSVQYTSDATWSWVDFEQGMQYRQQQYRGRMQVTLPASAAAPAAVPEPTTALHWAVGLASAFVIRRRSACLR